MGAIAGPVLPWLAGDSGGAIAIWAFRDSGGGASAGGRVGGPEGLHELGSAVVGNDFNLGAIFVGFEPIAHLQPMHLFHPCPIRGLTPAPTAASALPAHSLLSLTLAHPPSSSAHPRQYL